MTHATSTVSPDPITIDWKISEVLQRYPELLFELVEIAPAFSKLRNPILRRVQSRLVTVGQAAQIADLDPAYLVRRLNAAAGIEVSPPQAPTPVESSGMSLEPHWVKSAAIAKELDARPYQQRGEEPFSAIMEASRQVPPGHVLLLRNTFEPTPLFDVLGQRGFEHWTRKLAENDWEIRFFNSGSQRDSRQEATHASPVPDPDTWDAPTATLTIDVSELVPPEPMIRILTALEELPAGASLLVHHVRRPMHLYPRLDELGCRHVTRDIGPGRVELLIQTPAVADRATG